MDEVGKATGFFLFRNFLKKYREIRDDESKRVECKRYGNMSIILSIISLIISIGFILLFGVSAFGDLGLFGFGSVLSKILSIVAGIVIPVVLSIYSMIFAIMQIRLNRKAIGVIAMIISVIAMLTALSMIVLMIVL